MTYLQNVLDMKYVTMAEKVRTVTDYIYLEQETLDTTDCPNLEIVNHYFQILCEAYHGLTDIDERFELEEWAEYFENGCIRFAEAFILANRKDFTKLQIVIDLAWSFKSLLKFKFFFDNSTERLMDYPGGVSYPCLRKGDETMQAMMDNLERITSKDIKQTVSLIEEYSEDDLVDEITISDEEFIDDRSETQMDDEKEESNNLVTRKRLRRLID